MVLPMSSLSLRLCMGRKACSPRLLLNNNRKLYAIHQLQLRCFSQANVKNKPEQNKRKEQEEPLTNKKIWDQVLAQHPEEKDSPNTDLLYEYSRKSYFGILSAGSLAHIAFWSWLKGYEESLYEMMPAVGEPTTFSWITNDFGTSLGLGSSILLAFLVSFHARRAVGRISVVAGGDKLRITTHKFLGDFAPPRDFPIGQISAHPNTKNNIILKIGKEKGFFLVDTKGNFYNRKKLESMITFRTDFSVHSRMKTSEEKDGKAPIRTDLPKTDLKATITTRTATAANATNPSRRTSNVKKHASKQKTKTHHSQKNRRGMNTNNVMHKK